MKLVTINNALLLKYTADSEVLQKSTRPYVLVVRLKYKDACYDFAVPIRSNIPASAPKDQYFSLPPRPQTRSKNRHGLHYIKMFPVTKQEIVDELDPSRFIGRAEEQTELFVKNVAEPVIRRNYNENVSVELRV